jgi:hypothetical protein
MRYCALILQPPTPYFFSVAVLQWCHECFVWWLERLCWVRKPSFPEII